MKRNGQQGDTDAMEKYLMEHSTPDKLLDRTVNESLAGYLNTLMGRRKISTDVLAELSGMNRSSMYRILNGKTKFPQRNIIIRLSLILQLSFGETQNLLKLGCKAALSGQRGRDIIISDGIIHKRHIEDINEKLRSYGFSDLYSRE